MMSNSQLAKITQCKGKEQEEELLPRQRSDKRNLSAGHTCCPIKPSLVLRKIKGWSTEMLQICKILLP